MRRHIPLLAATPLALLAAVPLLAAFGLAATATAATARPAIFATAPGGTYVVGSGHYSASVTITSNPSAYNVRVKNVCLKNTVYSTWHTSGTFGATCSGSGNTIASASVQYSETFKYTITFWTPGKSLTGSW